MPWRPLPLSYAIAIYPFQPSATSTVELPLQIGDQLYVVEEGGKDYAWCRGYLLQSPSLLSSLTSRGSTASDARVFSGVFPKCCVGIKEQLAHDVAASLPQNGDSKPHAPVPMLKIGDESATSNTEPLVDEIASSLREWYTVHVPGLVLKQEYERLDRIAEIVRRLDYSRRQLLNDVLTLQERFSVRDDAVWDLVRGNKLLGAEVIVRDPEQKGRLLTADDSGVAITRLQSIFSLLDHPPINKQETTRLYHCILDIKPSNISDAETINLSFALYQISVDGRALQLSETFATTAAQNTTTLFADLSSIDVASDSRLYMVVKALVSQSSQNATLSSSPVERPPSRGDTLKNTRDSILGRRRSTMKFGSKRKVDKSTSTPGGRVMSSVNENNSDLEKSIQLDSKKRQTGPPVPRVVAVGVFDVAAILRSGHETTVDIRLWEVSHDTSEENETDWPEILAQLLGARDRHFLSCKRLPSITVGLRPYTAPDADVLIRSNPTSMHLITKSQRIGFSEAPVIRRSDIYLTISSVKLPQNGAFSHPQFGAVPIKPVQMFNMQATMELRDNAGRRLERCIYPSSNGSAVTAMRTHAIELGGVWDQTICIRLPVDKVADAHLVLSIADAPEFPFALAWMPLWDKQSFLKDAQHSLILHAYDKSTSTFSDAGKGMYLNLPWDHSILSKQSEAQIASLEVRTQLVSTEFSQDARLASLFNWRALPTASLLDMLQKLVFVPEVEIAKQLTEVLDALFAILDYKAGIHQFQDLVFNDIVFVLGIIHDRRFNLGPRVERYADEHFKAPKVAQCLTSSLTRLLQSVSDPQSARDLRALFKVGQQFMRLLMSCHWQHYESDRSQQAKGSHSTFKEDMRSIFFGLQMMMRSDTAALVGSKTLLVQNFHSWLPELLPVYSKSEVVEIAVDMVDACANVTGKLSLYRLILIINYTKNEQLWETDEDWQTLVKNSVRWLAQYWPPSPDVASDWRDQVRLCSSVIVSLLSRPIPGLHDFLPDLMSTYILVAAQPSPRHRSLSLLFPTAYPFITKSIEASDHFDETLLELAAVISEISKIQRFTVNEESLEQKTEHIAQALEIVSSVLSHNTSPSTWLSLNVYHHSAALHILMYVAKQLEIFYLPDPEHADTFEMELWKAYFEILLSLVSSPVLTLELFSEQRRRAVWKIAGDIRQIGADLLRTSWVSLGWEAADDDLRRYNLNRLGGYQVQYVPGLVGPIIEICLSMHEGLRKVAVEVLQTMIISEWSLNEDLSLVETEIIGTLNTILKARSATTPLTGNEVVARKLFVGELLESFSTIANQPEDALWRTLEDLVSTIVELIDLVSGHGAEEENSRGTPRPVNGTIHKSGVDLPDRSISRLEGKVYGSQALDLYKKLAEEYERSGDYKRLAKTYRAIARIHEARASSRLSDVKNNEQDIEEED